MSPKLPPLLVLFLVYPVATCKPSVKPVQQRQQTHKPAKAKKKTMPYLKWGVGLVAIGPVWYYRDRLSPIFKSITPQNTDDSLSDTSSSDDEDSEVIDHTSSLEPNKSDSDEDSLSDSMNLRDVIL